MKRVAIPVETNELCFYGCGCIARFKNGSGNLMCLERSNSCPAIKRKNSEKIKKAHEEGRIPGWSAITNEQRSWRTGLTKTDPRIAKSIETRKQRIRDGIYMPHRTKCSDATKAKLSKTRSDWLKVPGNRKNYGRGKKSWMELCFEKYLKDNSIVGWDSEFHVHNIELGKNYFVDFVFEDKKMMIELDGTQHRKTVEQDKIRDLYMSSIGYRVVRIPYEEFKRRYFSTGFMDILGD